MRARSRRRRKFRERTKDPTTRRVAELCGAPGRWRHSVPSARSRPVQDHADRQHPMHRSRARSRSPKCRASQHSRRDRRIEQHSQEQAGRVCWAGHRGVRSSKGTRACCAARPRMIGGRDRRANTSERTRDRERNAELEPSTTAMTTVAATATRPSAHPTPAFSRPPCTETASHARPLMHVRSCPYAVPEAQRPKRRFHGHRNRAARAPRAQKGEQ